MRLVQVWLLLSFLLLQTSCLVKGKGKVTVGEPAASSQDAVPILDVDFPPQNFKDLDLFADGEIGKPRLRTTAYSVRAPLWSDGSEKQRFVWLPKGETIRFDAGRSLFIFPTGTMLVKHFAAPEASGKGIETRVMRMGGSGKWTFATYQWMEDGRTELRDKVAYTNGYRIPSHAECEQCHGGEPVLGLVPSQVSDTLAALAAGGIMSKDDAEAAANVQARVDPADEKHPLDLRARSYLTLHCGTCHRPGGPMAMMLLDEVNLNPELLVKGGYVSPGRLETSRIWTKFTAKKYRMPPVSLKEDPLGTALLRTWIEAMPKSEVTP